MTVALALQMHPREASRADVQDDATVWASLRSYDERRPCRPRSAPRNPRSACRGQKRPPDVAHERGVHGEARGAAAGRRRRRMSMRITWSPESHANIRDMHYKTAERICIAVGAFAPGRGGHGAAPRPRGAAQSILRRHPCARGLCGGQLRRPRGSARRVAHPSERRAATNRPAAWQPAPCPP